MLFLGMANAYVMRTNMSVAIVAMVNHTAITKEDEIFDDECGDRELEVVSNEMRFPLRSSLTVLSFTPTGTQRRR